MKKLLFLFLFISIISCQKKAETEPEFTVEEVKEGNRQAFMNDIMATQQKLQDSVRAKIDHQGKFCQGLEIGETLGGDKPEDAQFALLTPETENIQITQFLLNEGYSYQLQMHVNSDDLSLQETQDVKLIVFLENGYQIEKTENVDAEKSYEVSYQINLSFEDFEQLLYNRISHYTFLDKKVQADKKKMKELQSYLSCFFK